MKDSYKLMPTEIFFLGRLMHARYIDYAYVAMMPDIQKNYGLKEESAKECLEDKGLIELDFSGDAYIPEETRMVFEPVFFGNRETRIDNGENHRIHILGNRLTMSIESDDAIVFNAADEDSLGALLQGALHIYYSDIDKGVTCKSFTGEQMNDPEYRKEALELIKGEM